MANPNQCLIKIEYHKFFNVTLQAVFHIPPFVNWLHMSNAHHKNCDRDTCIVCSMSELQRLTLSSTTPVSSSSLYNKLQVTLQSQNDPSEFLGYLFNLSVEGFDSANTFFSGCFVSDVTCRRCSVQSITCHPFQELKFEKNKADTIENAIKRYLQNYFQEPDDCESCKAIESTTKRLTLEKTPAVLWIQLDDGKVNNHITISNTIDFKHLSGDESDNQATYRLVSMITHCRCRIPRFDYYSTIGFVDGAYYEYRDGKSRQIELDRVNVGRPYILFYELESNNINETASSTVPPTSSNSSPMQSLKYPLSSTPLQLPKSSDENLPTYSIIISTTTPTP